MIVSPLSVISDKLLVGEPILLLHRKLLPATTPLGALAVQVMMMVLYGDSLGRRVVLGCTVILIMGTVDDT